ncbi:hypothetical protein GYB22_03635 [bacterium]|nr:hypothetical protein [bacterium]
MYKISLVLMLSALLFGQSCVSGPGHAEAPSADTSTSVIIGDPFQYGEESILIFPVGRKYTPEIIEAKLGISSRDDYSKTLNFNSNESQDSRIDKRANREFVNMDDLQNDIRNILFYDKESGKTYPLSLDTLHILSFAIHADFTRPLIFYRIVKHDFNQDSVYTDKDGVMLYVSDEDGKNFTQITPEDEQFLSYDVHYKDDMILIKSRIDVNGDKEYNDYDETNFRTMSLSNPEFGKEIFTKDLKDSIRALMKD